MIISPSKESLINLIKHQIHNFFILGLSEVAVIEKSLPKVLVSVENCFSRSENKYYKKEGSVFFSIYHSGQYSIFLYFLSRRIFLDFPEFRDLSDKVYYLNKALNGLDLYYEVSMPLVFHLDHPVGSVMGRAVYGENFSFSQLCTVGNNKGIYPEIGANVKMLSGSKILGNSKIGDNCIIAANAYVKDTDVPRDSIVFGSYPSLVIKKRK